jgi:hypothetical protein
LFVLAAFFVSAMPAGANDRFWEKNVTVALELPRDPLPSLAPEFAIVPQVVVDVDVRTDIEKALAYAEIERMLERVTTAPTPWQESSTKAPAPRFWNSKNATFGVAAVVAIVWDLEETYDNLDDKRVVLFENPNHPGWIAAGQFREGNWFGKLVIPHGRWVAYPAFIVEKGAMIYVGHLLRVKGAQLMREKGITRAAGVALYVTGHALPGVEIGGQFVEAWRNHRWPPR